MQTQQIVGPMGAPPIALPPTDPFYAGTGRVLLTIWRAMTTSPRVAVGSAIVSIFILVGIFGPFFLPGDPEAISKLSFAPPSAAHWLGTTWVGQDIFMQLIYGTRTSVFWGLGTGLLVTLVSVVVGLVGEGVGLGVRRVRVRRARVPRRCAELGVLKRGQPG